MPYIKEHDRTTLNFAIDEIVTQLGWLQPDVLKRPGPTNYVVTRIVARTLKPEEGWSYHSISRALGVLRDAAAEMQRRLMDTREDAAIENNGDIPEYSSSE